MKYKLEQKSKKTDYFTVNGLLLSKINKLSTELINLIGLLNVEILITATFEMKSKL